MKGFDVFDFKGVEEEVVDSKEGEGIVCVEAERVGLDEVGGLL